MTTTSTNDVVGRALYIEAARNTSGVSYTLQLLLLPEVRSRTDQTVNMSLYRRRISTIEPRKTWRHHSSPTSAARCAESRGGTSSADELIANDMLFFCKSTLNSLVDQNNNYKLVGQPIVVDVTQGDYDDVRLGKTPYKVLGRVWKSRKKLGFPETFLPS